MRYNIFGAPGAGKSLAACELYSRLRRKGEKVELVREKIKQYAYIGRVPTNEERLRFFLEEYQEELFYLSNGIDIISDSPIWLSNFYSESVDNNPYKDQIRELATHIDCLFSDQTNIFVTIGPKEKYEKSGRYQCWEEAKQIEKMLLTYLSNNQRYIDEFLEIT